MGFLDNVKATAMEVSAKAKEGVEDVQAKVELDRAYNELGKVAFELVESSEITHPKLDTVAEKIRAINERDKADGDLSGAAAGGTSETDASSPPTS